MTFRRLISQCTDNDWYRIWGAMTPSWYRKCNPMLSRLDSSHFDREPVSRFDTLRNQSEEFDERFKAADRQKLLVINPSLQTNTMAIFNRIVGGFYYDPFRRNDPSSWFFMTPVGEHMKRSDQEKGVVRVQIDKELPSQEIVEKRISEIDHEISKLPSDLQHSAEALHAFHATCFKDFFWMSSYKDLLSKIVDYRAGLLTIDQIEATRENAPTYLKLVKLADLVFTRQSYVAACKVDFPKSSYGLRLKLLQLLSPQVTTLEVFTRTLRQDLLKNPDYQSNPSNWMEERLALYERTIFPLQREKLDLLNQRLGGSQPTLYIIKGSTATGKTFFARQRFQQALNDQGEIDCMNPDKLKLILKTNTLAGFTLTNTQVHDEVSRGPLNHYYKKEIQQFPGSLIVDKPFPNHEDLDFLLETSRNNNKWLDITDIHAPLQDSFERILTSRSAGGKDPCPLPREITRTYQETVRCRMGIIQRIIDDPIVVCYQLYFSSHASPQQLVAEKKEGTFRIYSQELLDQCTTVPTHAQVEELLEQKVVWANHEMVMREALECQAFGLSTKEAITEHLTRRKMLESFGPVPIQNYTGSWLADFPNLQEHIETEHRLHIRGTDLSGRGLHWQTNKFAWKLNPRFNPEESIQMKLGYFILPPDHVDMHEATRPTPPMMQEIEIRSTDGELAGYRFFVHPEAYSHYVPLLLNNIPFVQPEASEFIGTPTSSYRSWLVRRVSENEQDYVPQADALPFIVKLGVAGVGDNSRLLTSGEVIRSIKREKMFDTEEPHPRLNIFKERFGITLKDIEGYPAPAGSGDIKPLDSGLIFREVPQQLLSGNAHLYSFSALMSAEPRISPLSGFEGSLPHLPLIYPLIQSAIDSGAVSSAYEFIEKYFIHDMLETFRKIIFEDRFSLSIHGQNLCLAVDNQGVPLGFALRDLADFQHCEGFLETYTWYYRYHIFIKLLNVLTRFNEYYLPPIPGAPIQIGETSPVKERSLYHHLMSKQAEHPFLTEKEKQALESLTLTVEETHHLLATLDTHYFGILDDYFDTKRSSQTLTDFHATGLLPSAELGSASAVQLREINRRLWMTIRQTSDQKKRTQERKSVELVK